jgi:putative transposase
MRLYCFVIMADHIHFIAQFTKGDPLADVMRDLKKHTSDRFLRELKAEKDSATLEKLAGKIKRPDKQTHVVWEDDPHARDVFSMEFLQLKMD